MADSPIIVTRHPEPEPDPAEQAPAPWWYYQMRQYFDSLGRAMIEQVYGGDPQPEAVRFFGVVQEKVESPAGASGNMRVQFPIRGAETPEEAWAGWQDAYDAEVPPRIDKAKANLTKAALQANAIGAGTPPQFGPRRRNHQRGH